MRIDMLSKSEVCPPGIDPAHKGIWTGSCPYLGSGWKERIPKKFLESILLSLRNKGILQSKKGKGDIFWGSLLTVSPWGNYPYFRWTTGPLPCVSQTAYRKCDECEDEITCGIRPIMKEVRDETARILDGTTLSDLLNNVEKMTSRRKEALVFHI